MATQEESHICEYCDEPMEEEDGIYYCDNPECVLNDDSDDEDEEEEDLEEQYEDEEETNPIYDPAKDEEI